MFLGVVLIFCHHLLNMSDSNSYLQTLFGLNGKVAIGKFYNYEEGFDY